MSERDPAAGPSSVPDEVRRVLLPPLRFASRDAFAAIGRLKGFEGLVTRTLTERAGHFEGAAWVEGLRSSVVGFDAASDAQRRERVQQLLALLGETGESSAAHSTPSASPPSSSRAPTSGGSRPRHSPSLPARAKTAAPDRAHDVEASPTRRRDSPGRPPVEVVRTEGATRDFFREAASLLPGVGPAKLKKLEERGVGTLGGLLLTLPRTYDDRRDIRPLGELEAGSTAVVRGEIVSAGQIGRGRGARLEVLLDDGTGRLKLTFFRFRYQEAERRFPQGATITAVGEVARYKGALQMVHPIVAAGERTEEMSGVWPVYPEMRGLHPAELGRHIRSAAQRLQRRPLRDLVPRWILDDVGLPDINVALRSIHLPDRDLDRDALLRLAGRQSDAHLRLAFDEVFVLQLAMGLRRAQGITEPSLMLAGADADELWEELLPFSPTGAQRRASAEVLTDLVGDAPMGRLLQGDVGAGKTAVAAVAALRAVRAKTQAAIMAPTEILAEQHHHTMSRLFSPRRVRVGLFTGGRRGKARTLQLAKLANGEIDIAIGTHALLSDDVAFRRLGLCVIDEQHRFGVVQRMQLKEKGPLEDGRPVPPHILVMTATPIPRSLALTVYGDLAVSVLDELPPGRTPVKTRVLQKRDEDLAWAGIDELLQRGERAYVVYPLIEESEKLDLANATAGFDALSERFGTEQVALIHGRIASDVREETMARFSDGRVKVLVSTTVIEVGVDVPEATCMVVMNAERFGLSQLHQLRGRVGRSHRPSACFLIVGEDGAGQDGFRRLRVMEETNDGFRIAEEDLAIRGPGDFLGTRQHGLPTFAFCDLTEHAGLIEKARVIVERILAEDPELDAIEHRDLRDLVFERYADRLALAGAG